MGDGRNKKNETRKRNFPILVSLPLLVPVIGLLIMFGARHLPQTEQQNANDAARFLINQELQHLRTGHYRDTAHAAYSSAQGFVRSSLLPANSAVDAHFPKRSAARIRAMSVTPSGKAQYRVRATVSWRDPSGRMVRRRFETDMIHSPTDGRWRLIDTEFLP